MKKKIYNLFIIVSIFCLIMCICLRISYTKFNSSRVKQNIDYLSSSQFKGRLAGTDENNIVAEKIEKEFSRLKLKPLDNNFQEKFTISVPTYTGGKSSLKLINKDKSTTEFVLGKDFKEDFLNFKNPSIEFSKNDRVDIYNNGFSLFKDNIEYLFYVNHDKDFAFRSSFYEDSKYGFVIQISTETFSKILDSLRTGSTLKVDLSYKVEQKEICNVAGKIEGYSKNLAPLILTAHFDHVGSNTLGEYYPGALDNASGISFLLELARTYSTLRIPERDIIFVALNAEELGLKGSEAFACKYKDSLKGAEIINFDMIGVDNYPITLMSGKDCVNKHSDILEDIENICNKKDVSYGESFADSSDHTPFINNGFDALTLSHCDLSNIHTPNDTCDKISTNAIDITYSIVNDKVTGSAYNDIFLIFYRKDSLIFFIVLCCILISYKFFGHIKKAA